MSQETGTPELRDATAGPLPEAGPALALCIEKTRRNVPALADHPKACDWAVAGLSVQRAVSRRDAKRNCLTPLIAGTGRSIL